MATYTFHSGGLAPLQIQLGPGLSGGSAAPVTVRLREASAQGEGTVGTVNNPILYRPSTLGTTNSPINPISVDNTGISTAQIMTAFSGAPSVPPVQGSGKDLPLNLRMVFPYGAEMIFYSTVATPAALVLYATASGGATWSAGLTWEER